MLKYIIKRILLSILILFGVSIIIYVLVRIQPGDNFIRKKYSAQLAQGGNTIVYVDDAGNPILDENGNIQKVTDIEITVRRMEKTYGLDTSPIEGYFKWLGNMLKGNWGDSFIFSVESGDVERYYIDNSGGSTQYVPIEKDTVVPAGASVVERAVATQSVIYIIYKKCGISFLISFIATFFEFLLAIPLGIMSARKQYGALDYTVTVLAMMGISLPTFFLGALMLKIFSVDLGWFPYAGLTDPNSGLPWIIDAMYHLVLPLTTLIVLSIGGLMRYTRTNMLEVLNADYIRTARAKGLSEHSVIYKHAFRNSLIPIVTMLAGILPGLFGGAMITETVFSIDGIGKAAYKAVTQGDIPFIMAYNMFLSLLTVIGTLLSDLMYAVVDPRVKITD